jgi:hypothetical protein
LSKNKKNEEEEQDEEYPQKLTEEELEKGLTYLKNKSEDTREEVKAVLCGKITAEDVYSRIFVDTRHSTEDLTKEARAKGLHTKKQITLFHADKALQLFKDELLAARAAYQLERNYAIANPSSSSSSSSVSRKRLEAARNYMQAAKEGIKMAEDIRREIEESQKKKNKKK